LTPLYSQILKLVWKADHGTGFGYQPPQPKRAPPGYFLDKGVYTASAALESNIIDHGKIKKR
jgi:hypothetical protein